jgi:hypothetical protein
VTSPLTKWLLAALLLALLSVGAAAQSEEAEEHVPEPYGEQEFSPAARSLRRAEIILFGSLPLTLFLSLEVYDFYRFARNDWDFAYAPFPLRPPAAAGYEVRESAGVLLGAVTVSALLALADYMIGRVRERRAEDPDPHRR